MRLEIGTQGKWYGFQIVGDDGAVLYVSKFNYHTRKSAKHAGKKKLAYLERVQ